MLFVMGGFAVQARENWSSAQWPM